MVFIILEELDGVEYGSGRTAEKAEVRGDMGQEPTRWTTKVALKGSQAIRRKEVEALGTSSKGGTSKGGTVREVNGDSGKKRRQSMDHEWTSP